MGCVGNPVKSLPSQNNISNTIAAMQRAIIVAFLTDRGIMKTNNKGSPITKIIGTSIVSIHK
jgi:hypothetical protein